MRDFTAHQADITVLELVARYLDSEYTVAR